MCIRDRRLHFALFVYKKRIESSVSCFVDPEGPFHACWICHAIESCVQLRQAYGAIFVRIDARIKTQKPLCKVCIVIGGPLAVNMPVNVPAAVSHRLPIGHGVMAHHDFHAVDFQYLDWRFYNEMCIRDSCYTAAKKANCSNRGHRGNGPFERVRKHARGKGEPSCSSTSRFRQRRL